MIRALVLLLALAPRASADDLFAEKAAAWEAKGYGVRERASRSADGLTASVAVYSPREKGGDRLEIYVATKDKAYLGSLHPSTMDRLELEPDPAGRFTDLLRDGSRVIAYRASNPALGTTELSLVRWKKFKLERVAVLPEASFLKLDDKPAIMSRALPLGLYLSVACEDYGTMSRTAYKTTLHAPRGGKLADVSAAYPSFYEHEIDRKAKALERLKGSLEQNAGEYLGLAISSYYDYAAIGRGREGWKRLRGFFDIPAFAPPAVKTCMAAMEKDLRAKLGVPASWP